MEPAIESGIHAVNDAVNPVIASSLAPGPGASVNLMQIILFLASRLWAAGVAAGFLYAFASWLRLRRRVAAAMRLEGNLWLCDEVKSPLQRNFGGVVSISGNLARLIDAGGDGGGHGALLRCPGGGAGSNRRQGRGF